MVGEQDLAVYLSKFDKKYWLTYKVLDILQKVAYPSLQPFLSDGKCLTDGIRSWIPFLLLTVIDAEIGLL